MDTLLHCDAHEISACGVCMGTVEPWEPPAPAEGKVHKPYYPQPIDYLRPLYNERWRAERVPAPPVAPFGNGGTAALDDLHRRTPQGDHLYGAHRQTRNGHKVTGRKRVYRAKPKPKATVPAPLPGGADPATVAWAERLGVSL